MTEVRVSYATDAGNAEPVAWVSMPREQWDVQMEVTRALQERADKAEAECEQWPRLLAFLRARLAGCQKHNRELVGEVRHWEADWHKREQREVADITEMRTERDAAQVALAEATRLLESLTPGGSEFAADPKRCAEWVQQRRSEELRLLVQNKAALGRASLLLNDAATGLELTRHISSETSGYIERALRTANAIRAFLTDPTGQAAAERWQKLEALAVIARKHLYDDSNKTWLEFAEALDALDKGREGVKESD